MLQLRGSTGLHSDSAAITMCSCSSVGLAGAPSTLFHSFLTIGTILHPSCSLTVAVLQLAQVSLVIYIYVHIVAHPRERQEHSHQGT